MNKIGYRIALLIGALCLAGAGIVPAAAVHASPSAFAQGIGYEDGAYDPNAEQPAAFNWTRQSRFAGSDLHERKWSYETGGLLESSPAVGADGTVYIGSNDGKLYALDSRADGDEARLKWVYDAGDWIVSSPAIGADGVLYVGSHSGKLHALDLHADRDEERLKWTFETGDWIASSPAIGGDGTIYVGSYDGKLYALDPRADRDDERLKWVYDTGEWIVSSPAIGADGTVYVSSYGGRVYALNPGAAGSADRVKWFLDTGLAVESSPAIGADGTVYIGSYDGKVYALDPHAANPESRVKWAYETAGAVVSSPAIGADGILYVGSSDGKLYALDPDAPDESARVKWAYPTGEGIRSSPVIGADGAIYVGSYDGKLYALDSHAALKWSLQTDGGIRSSPAIGADGTVYVGSLDRKVHAFKKVEIAKSSNAKLSGIYLNAAPLEHFHPDLFSYRVQVPHAVDRLTVTAVTYDSHARYEIRGENPRPLAVGSQSISIVVTAEDEAHQAEYTLTVEREGGAESPAPDPTPGSGPDPEPDPEPDPGAGPTPPGPGSSPTPVTPTSPAESGDAESGAPGSPAGADRDPQLPERPAAGQPPAPDPSGKPPGALADIGGHWAAEALARAAAQGIVNGFPDGTFKPDEPVTRAQFIVMLVHVLDLQGEPAVPTFSDAAQIGAWAKQAIARSIEAGIVHGYADGSFRPAAPITRAEIAALIARALGWSDEARLASDFADEPDIPQWAKSAVAALQASGLLNGRSDNRFAPNDPATRAEAAVLLLALLDRVRTNGDQAVRTSPAPRSGPVKLVASTPPIPGEDIDDMLIKVARQRVLNLQNDVQQKVGEIQNRNQQLSRLYHLSDRTNALAGAFGAEAGPAAPISAAEARLKEEIVRGAAGLSEDHLDLQAGLIRIRMKGDVDAVAAQLPPRIQALDEAQEEDMLELAALQADLREAIEILNQLLKKG